jgi:hypothetical protein
LTSGTWNLRYEDGTSESFIDIRRKVGNQIVRAYLLKAILNSDRVKRVKISLRGPKNEFQDFAKFMIVRTKQNGGQVRLLAESGVYENLRIVGADSAAVERLEPDTIIQIFTAALTEPEAYDAIIWLITDSSVNRI